MDNVAYIFLPFYQRGLNINTPPLPSLLPLFIPVDHICDSRLQAAILGGGRRWWWRGWWNEGGEGGETVVSVKPV